MATAADVAVPRIGTRPMDKEDAHVLVWLTFGFSRRPKAVGGNDDLGFGVNMKIYVERIIRPLS